VQLEAIPYAVEGHDVLCQAKSGMGKTAVFVISVLNQLREENGEYEQHSCIVTCHTRELAHQILKDFRRLGKYFKKPELRIGCYFGGTPLQENREELEDKTKSPHVIIATPGRLYDLVKNKVIKVDNVKYFIIDECDQVLGNPKMRQDIQDVFIRTPHSKQVMMFSATMPESIKADCKKFMQNEVEIFIDESKLVLHGLVQYYTYLQESKKF
jgi:ATP-dependent RNA helicase UAP56/SUB2